MILKEGCSDDPNTIELITTRNEGDQDREKEKMNKKKDEENTEIEIERYGEREIF